MVAELIIFFGLVWRYFLKLLGGRLSIFDLISDSFIRHMCVNVVKNRKYL
jgi:hypothetical protein